MIRRFLPLFLALTLAACAFPVPPTRPVPPSRGLAVDAVLAPFEDAALLPRELAGLPYDEGRAYALLVVLPSPGAVDLSDPARAHRGLGAFLNQIGRAHV